MAEQEIELKLTLDAGELSRFRRDPLIHRAKEGRAASKTLVAVYFDTPDLALRSNRAALRLRLEGRERVQTLKLSGGGTGLQHRTEFNAPAIGETPDLSLIDDDEVAETVRDWVGGAPLVPIFSTDIRRTIWMLALDGARVELALDVGTVESAGRDTSILEAEFELKDGEALPLLDFARDIADRYNVHVEERSKAAKGYALFQGQTPQAHKAAKMTLDPDASAWSSLGRIVEEGTAQLLKNEEAVFDGANIEGVHQSRVAVRRTRAALSAFRSILPDETRKRLNKPLRRHQLALGPARDWDVFLDEVLLPLQRGKGDRKFSAFVKRAEEARRLGYARAHREMRSSRFGRLQLELVRFPFLPPPDGVMPTTREFASTLLDERLAAVRLAAGEHPSKLEELALHAFRIDIKKLRYAIDFFRSIYPKEALSPWRSVGKSLQDCLGGLNDAAVQRALLDAMDAPDKPVSKSVRRRIEAFNEERVDAGLAKLDEAWRAFESLVPFWR
jgi:triphosphatase